MNGADELSATMLGIVGGQVTDRSDAQRDREVSALFDAYYEPMCRLAFVILGDGALAEEIVMEAMLKTFSGWRRLRDKSRADAYLRRAVINLCRSKIRRRIVERRVNALTVGREALRAPDWDPERHEANRLVWLAVRNLPSRQRACVVMRYYEDLPEAEIAEALGCSVGTVKSQLAKARRKLEQALAGERLRDEPP